MSNVSVSTGKPGEQTVVTPHDFIARVCTLWPCIWDLAATRENARFPAYFTQEDDSLSQDWKKVIKPKRRDHLWLNPPFSSVNKWMEKCVEEMDKGCKIVTLTLANRGTKWYREIVRPNSLSLILTSRLKFEGNEHLYPKELMINVFDSGVTGEGYWDWKQTEPWKYARG